MKYSLQWGEDSAVMGGENQVPGTYQKMDDSEGGRRHKHRHHSHHKHRHSENNSRHNDKVVTDSRHGRHPSTDTSLEINPKDGRNFEVESTYKDSLYSPNQKDSVYSPATKDSLYSGDDGSTRPQVERYHSNSGESGRDQRLTSPGRFSPRPKSKNWDSSRERHGENTFDHVTKNQSRRGQEDRIWQDPVSRGAESGQIRAPEPHHHHHNNREGHMRDSSNGGRGDNMFSDQSDNNNMFHRGHSSAEPQKARKGETQHSKLRAYIEPGRPGSGLAAAAALARGEPHAYGGARDSPAGKLKVPPPVPQKPDKSKYNKMGMDDLWPGGWDEYSE